jgi:hypothetical protein
MVGFGSDRLGSSLFGGKPSQLAKTLMERLSAIPGVNGGHLHGYEVSVNIGEAFSWKDLGPIVLGEIVNTIYPEILGKTIAISAELSWTYYSSGGIWEDDDGQRIRAIYVLDHQEFEVKDPQILDIENHLGSDALVQAKGKARAEAAIEK